VNDHSGVWWVVGAMLFLVAAVVAFGAWLVMRLAQI